MREGHRTTGRREEASTTSATNQPLDYIESAEEFHSDRNAGMDQYTVVLALATPGKRFEKEDPNSDLGQASRTELCAILFITSLYKKIFRCY